MNDRQRDIIDAAVDSLAPHAPACSREEVARILYNLVLDCRQPPRQCAPAVLRRSPLAGEVLPPAQRASWARARTPHDL